MPVASPLAPVWLRTPPNGTRHKAHSFWCHPGSRWREEAKVGGDFQEIDDHVRESRASQFASMTWLIVANSFLCAHLSRFTKNCNIQPAKKNPNIFMREKKETKPKKSPTVAKLHTFVVF